MTPQEPSIYIPTHGVSLIEVFVLTTQSTHWFLEQGFEPTEPELLPVERQHLYNWQRNAAVLKRGI